LCVLQAERGAVALSAAGHISASNMEVWVRVLGLRQLPPGTVKGPVRVQAILAEERRETGDSVSKGTKTQVRV
jgi:hypothetical protein